MQRSLYFFTLICCSFVSAAAAEIDMARSAEKKNIIWGEERAGIKMGVQIERTAYSSQDRITLTTLVTNYVSKQVTVYITDANGDICPQYEIRDGKNILGTIAPPRLLLEKIDDKRVPPIKTLDIPPGETVVIHTVSSVYPNKSADLSVTIRGLGDLAIPIRVVGETPLPIRGPEGPTAAPRKPAPSIPAAKTTGRGNDESTFQNAVSNARYYLIRQLDPDKGCCVMEYDEGSARHGIETALVLRALSLAGEKYDSSPVIRRGYAWLIEQPQRGPEFVPLRILALCASSKVDQSFYASQMADVKWLMEGVRERQSTRGRFGGGEGPTQEKFDNLGDDRITYALDAVSGHDVLVPKDYWARNLRAWLKNQYPAGYWPRYPSVPRDQNGEPSLTMTAAGIDALHISMKHLAKSTDEDLLQSADEGLKRAKKWLNDNFILPAADIRGYSYENEQYNGFGRVSITSPELGWSWLVNLGRLHALDGMDIIAKTDPWKALSDEFIGSQNANGSWGGVAPRTGGIWNIQLTASAVIFLTSVTNKQPAEISK
jgi:hypothetical protein